jgi:hypothetical protein
MSEQLAHKNRLASAASGRIEQPLSWTASKVWPVLNFIYGRFFQVITEGNA